MAGRPRKKLKQLGEIEQVAHELGERLPGSMPEGVLRNRVR